MNTSGPNGGKGARSQTVAKKGMPTSRATGYTKAAGKNRGDTSLIAARNLDGQKPAVSRIARVKQAAVNKGPMTDFNVSRQNLSRTKPPMPAYNKNSGQPRGMQNSMSGKGTPQG